MTFPLPGSPLRDYVPDRGSGLLRASPPVDPSGSLPQKPHLAPKGRTVKPVRGNPNGTESRYSKRLDARILAGEVRAYWYEAIKFRLADGSWFCPDFFVMLASGLCEIHETKGGFTREAALIRLKVTSELFWIFAVRLVREKPKGIFTITEVGR